MVTALVIAALAASQTPATNRSSPVVVVIGADGLTFDVIEPLVKAGKLPNIGAMLDTGIRAVLQSEKPMRSPALWTTIATGQPRHVHRIYDFVTDSGYWPEELRKQKRRLVTSDMRASPAIWQIASAAEKRSLIVGWLNTWPAEQIDGVMVAPYVALNDPKQTSIKGRVYRDAQGQSYPAELFESLVDMIVPTEAVPAKRIRPLANVPPPSSPLYRDIPNLERYVFALNWSVASTLTNTRMIEHINRKHGRFDLVMTYFDGSDTLAHRFWVMRQSLPEIRARLQAHGMDPKHAEELKRRFGHVLEGYYRLIDNMVGRIRSAVGRRATLVLVSDHGWGSSEGTKARHDTVPFDGEHRLEGVFIAQGPKIKPGRVAPLSLYEIAPTVLYLMGLDPPDAMPGRVATEIIRRRNLRAHQPGRSSKTLPGAPAEMGVVRDAPHTDEELERLRSLGYVE